MFYIRNGYTPSTKNHEFWIDGTIPWFTMKDIRANGHYLSESIEHITEKGVKKSGLFPANSIALATTATIGEHALIIVDCLGNQQFSFFTKRELLPVEVNMEYMNYYFFIVDRWCKEHMNPGVFASVDMDSLKNLKISFPTDINEQKRIVEILDKFSALISDISEGLPAEIKMRHQQYEYYRDKLLNFKRLEVV